MANAVRQARLGARVILLQLACALARGYDKDKHLHMPAAKASKKGSQDTLVYAAAGDEAKHGCMRLIAGLQRRLANRKRLKAP